MSRTRLILNAVVVTICIVFVMSPAWAGSFQTVTNYSKAGATGPKAVVFADLDGDNKLDMAVVNNTSSGGVNDVAGNFTVYLGDGAGAFGTGTNVNVATPAAGKKSAPVAIAVGVFRTGQLADIVIADAGNTTQLNYCTNNSTIGNVSFSCASIDGGITANWVAVGHFTNSGCLDIAASDGGNNIQIYRGACDGTFQAPTSAAVGHGVDNFAVADFNKDGFDDLIAVAPFNPSNNEVFKVLNSAATDGTATFNAAQQIVVGTNPIFVATGDIKVDGNSDAVVVSSTANSNNVTVLIDDASGALTPTILSFSGTLKSAAIGDFDADGKGDLVLATNAASNNVLVAQGTSVNGNAFSAFSFSPLSAGTGIAHVSATNLNGDSHPDIETANNTSDNASVFLYTPFSNIATIAVDCNPPNNQKPVEGQPCPGPTDLLKFKYDGNPPDTTNFTGTVTWNDGSGGSDSALFIGPDGSNFFTLQGPTHVFPEQGTNFIPSITINNTADSSTTTVNGPTIIVDDGNLTALNPPDPSAAPDLPNAASVPHTYTNVVVANFTDQNPSAPTTDFTFTIDWDDCGPGGSVGTCAPGSLDTAGSVTGSGGSYSVVGTHTYNKAGLFTITTVITDAEGGGTKKTIPGAVVHANITTLTVTPVLTITGIEGRPLTDPTILATLTTTDGSPNLSAQVDFNCPTAPNGCSLSGTGISVVPSGGSCTAPVGGFCVVNTGTMHTYAEEGSFNIFVKVTDAADGSVGTTTSLATIADGALAPGAVGAIAGTFNEGSSTGVITVGTFTDENPNFVPADFPADLAHVKITWGDAKPDSAGVVTDGGCSTTPTPPYNPTACSTPGAFHVYNITGSHVYDEGGLDAPGGGLYIISIDVHDIGGSSLPGAPFASATIQVNDAPLNNLVVNTLTGGSGQGGAIVANLDTFVGAVATFHDTNTSPSSTPADFSGNIQWGDGTNTNFTSADVVSLGSGNYQINAPAPGHMFTKAGTQLTFVTVTVNDVGGASAGPTNSAAHANVTSLTGGSFLTPSPQIEGKAFSAPVAGFASTTASANFTISINWGDGSPAAPPSALTPGAPAPPLTPYTVSGDYTYPEENPFICGVSCTVTITVTDNLDGSVLTISGPVSVQDAALTALPAGGLVAQAGQPIVSQVVGLFQDDNTLAPVTDFTTVTVHWNDPNNPGASSTGTLNKLATPPGAPTQFQIVASYAGYSVNGNYQVTYDVVDKGGSFITAGNGVSITNSPGILTGTSKSLSPPSGSLSNAVIASFNNTNSSLPASNYFGTVDWGDGSPVENCSSSQVATPTCYYTQTSPGNFDVIGAHTYLQLGQSFAITVVVNDTIGGQTVTIVSGANIPNIVLTDFLGSTSPPQNLVKAGQLVDVLVTLAPNPNQGPFNSAVHFTGCTILSGPALTGLTCTFSPNSVPDVTQVRQVHVLVQSFSGSIAMQSPPPLRPNNPTQLALLLPGFVGVFGMVLLGGSKKNRRRTALWFGASLLLLTFLLVGCGGTGLTPAPPGVGGTRPGTYLLQINTDAGAASAPCAINGTGPCLTTQVTITQ